MAETTTPTVLPRGFRGAEQGWPALHRIPHPPYRVPLVGDVIGSQ
ncbi:cytochrome P450 [Streptomyces hirsutus]